MVAWLNNQLLYEEVESNSGLGKAIRYMLKYWDALTRFLHHAGAPIDNNLCEQMIKVMIRYRKNSFFLRQSMAASMELGKLLFGGNDVSSLFSNLFKAAPTVSQANPGYSTTPLVGLLPMVAW